MTFAAGGGEPMRSFIASQVGNSKSDLPLFVFIAFPPCCNSSCTASTWLPLTAHVRAVQPSKDGKLYSVFHFFKIGFLYYSYLVYSPRLRSAAATDVGN